MALTKAKVVLLMLIGVLTAASPNILRMLAAVLLLIYIIRYKEDESAARMAAFVAVGYSVALFPSPWHAVAAGVMLYLIHKMWEDAGFLGLLSGISMVTAYMFYTLAEQKLGWLYGVRLFYMDPATSLILGYGMFYTGVAIAAISMFLIFMKVAEEAAKAETSAERMMKRMAPKEKKEVVAKGEKKEAAAEEEEKKEVVAKAEEEKEAAAEEKPAEEKKVRARLPRSVEI
jgi:asparagine N-glycosylation enzyme membrane subunit Stt3